VDQAPSKVYSPALSEESAIRLRTSEALLLRAEQLANLGCWEVDVQAFTAHCSDQLFRLLGLEPESGPIPLDRIFELIHPEDRDKVRAKFLASIETNQPYDNETRYMLPDGRVRIFHGRALPIVGCSGRVIRMVGISQDVTDQKEAEEKLRKSEAMLAQAERLASLGSWEYDVERKSFTWSDQMYRMLGRPPGDSPVPLEEACAIFHPDDRARVWQDVLGIISEGHALENELRFVLPDGQVRIFHSRAVPVKNPLGVVHHIRGMSQDITERKRAEEELRRLSHQLLNIRDDERRRIARELHESAAQTLAALKLTLARLADSIPLKDEHGRQLLASSLQLTEDALQEIRTLSDLMHPAMLDLVGLGPALRWFAAGFSQRTPIHVQVEIEEDFGRLPQETETAVFRIVQEALTNIYRHSASRSAAVRVFRQENSIRVLIEDLSHSTVFPYASMAPNAPLGSGLAAIRERVKQLKGEFDIRSAPGKGATLSVVLPLLEG
jgi:PAS domain S-box-containing protein